jgi:hypothetical protein
MAQFENALKKLVEDPAYQDAVARDPTKLTKDFPRLDSHEMLLLMQVWHASGHSPSFRFIDLCHCCCSHR